MRKIAILLAAMGLMLAITAGTALAVTKIGTNGPNRLVGTAQNDTLRGLGGNDVLIGKGDNDRLFGGAGRDRLIGGADSDLLVGGPGNDFINARDPGRPEGDRINCGEGFDTVLVDPSTEDIVSNNCERVRVG